MLRGIPSHEPLDKAAVDAFGRKDAADFSARPPWSGLARIPPANRLPRPGSRSTSLALFVLVLSCTGTPRPAQPFPRAKQAQAAQAEPEKALSDEEMREFLLKAKVIKNKTVSKGITGVLRLTLSDGKITHDAAFQAIDETRTKMEFGNGRVEMNFRDSYKYDIAACEVAKLVGLGDMMPVTVERSYEGKHGALSWWLPVLMDEGQRLQKKIQPPDPEAWNKQIHKMRVFAQLVYDTDRNLGNVLISKDWHLWMIDFSRAFRIYHELENEKNLERCDRELLERMKRLDAAEVKAKTRPYLTSLEVEGLMARRDVIVRLFEKLAAKKGDGQVYY